MACETDYTLPISLQDVVRARENIGDMVRNTPVMTCSYLNGVAGFELFFKCENFQRTGSFKVRVLKANKAGLKRSECFFCICHASFYFRRSEEL